MLVLLLLLVFTADFASASEFSHPRIAIEYVLSKVQCSNPEDVAKIVFEGDSIWEGEFFWEEDFFPGAHTRFDEQPLGNGCTVYIFAPPGGNGRWAYRPSYFFTMADDNRLELLFDGKGIFTELIENVAWNGRHRIYQAWESFDEPYTYIRVWFWDGSQYVEAFTDERSFEGNEGSTREWNKVAKDSYLNARRTWQHQVHRWETLEEISKQYETPISEVLYQNGSSAIEIREGQMLHYDSSYVAAPDLSLIEFPNEE